MKILFPKTAFKILLVSSAMLALQCSRSPSQLAGGASTTEVSGIVVDSQGRPVEGAVALLRPIDYVDSNDSTDTTGTRRDVVSDSAGRYHFDNVKPGRYCIECIFKDSLGLAIDYSVDSENARQQLPDGVLKPLAVIDGWVPPPKPDGGRQPSVHVIGTKHSAPIDSTGHFILKVPEGQTRLLIGDTDRSDSEIDTIRDLKSGERLEWDHHDGDRHHPPDSLADSSGHFQQHADHGMNGPRNG
jgi:hypothetical protein